MSGEAFGVQPQRPSPIEWAKEMAERVKADPTGPEADIVRPMVAQLMAMRSVLATLPPHLRDAVDAAATDLGVESNG